MKSSQLEEFHHVLLRVNMRIANQQIWVENEPGKTEMCKQMSQIQTQLTKFLYLTPKQT